MLAELMWWLAEYHVHLLRWAERRLHWETLGRGLGSGDPIGDPIGLPPGVGD
jgi:hypothetical protein